ncbi:hypothetical protein RBB50_001975 [Rhinocladiella similis]
MTEELPNPKQQVPKIMMGTVLLSASAGLAMVLVFLFCTYDPTTLLTPVGGQAVFQILLDGMRSFGLTMFGAVLYDVVGILATPSAVLTTSRIVWSLAKHNNWPMGKWIGFVQPKNQIPVVAVWVTTIIATIISLLGFGSTTVLNGVFGAPGICFVPSYARKYYVPPPALLPEHADVELELLPRKQYTVTRCRKTKQEKCKMMAELLVQVHF